MSADLEMPCRSCGATRLAPVLDLGQTPLANSLLDEAALSAPEERFPLAIAFCPTCSLLQLTHSVPPEKLFREYLYFSSFSDTMLAHARKIANALTDTRGLSPSSLVVEVASNDGYLLQYYKERGVPVLGVEPAINIAKVAVEQRGIPTLSEFFGVDLADRLVTEGRRADVIHANNVLAHVPDLNGVVEGFARLVTPTGVVVVEAPYVVDMIEGCEFDTIYHEHLCYFSLTALDNLFARHGLTIFDVEHLAIHGGSLRIFASPTKDAPARTDAVKEMRAREEREGVVTEAYYARFAQRVSDLGKSLTAMLRELKAGGATIAAYGAAAKGSTLLNTFGIGRDLLDFVADRSTHKQGRYMPGVHLPIAPPSALLERNPSHVLLLTWNFADEILAQQAEYRTGGGKFIVPLPTPRLV